MFKYRPLIFILFFLLVSIPLSTGTGHATPLIHIVENGDTLESIAAQHHTSVQAIIEANAITNYSRLHVGQSLVIPAQSTGSSYRVVRGDTLSGIATIHNISLESLMSANDLTFEDIIYAGQTLIIPDASAITKAPAAAAPPPAAAAAPPPAAAIGSSQTHKIQRGDTLSGIASQYGVSLDAFLAANNLSTTSMIFAGQQVIIPKNEPAAAAPDAVPNTAPPVPIPDAACSLEGMSPLPNTDGMPPEHAMLTLVNYARAVCGVKPLKLNPLLTQAALTHGANMGRQGFFGHNDPHAGTSPFDRIRQAGYSYSQAGENLAAGFASATEAFTQLWKSDMHRANLINRHYTEIGLAYIFVADSPYQHYWAQTFATP